MRFPIPIPSTSATIPNEASVLSELISILIATPASFLSIKIELPTVASVIVNVFGSLVTSLFTKLKAELLPASGTVIKTAPLSAVIALPAPAPP